MELLLFLILISGLAIFFYYTGLLRSVVGIIFFLFSLLFIIGFAEAFIKDSAVKWSTILGALIVIPTAIAIRQHFYQKQLRWMRESEEYLARKSVERPSDSK